MTSYMPLLFTAFVYIPFGHVIVPLLEFWRRMAQTITLNKVPLPTQEFEINPDRISNQMYYFTVTAQIVNLVTELIVPYVKQQAVTKAREFQAKDQKNDLDHPEEAAILKQAREECEMDEYNVTEDYREMIMQYGKPSFINAPASALING